MARLAPRRWEDHYLSGRGYAPVADREWQLLTARLGPPVGRTLLDVGCGTGELTRRLSSAGYDTTGVDLSRTAIDLAKEEAVGATGPRFVQWDADLEEPGAALPRAGFDALLCRLVWVFLGPAARRRVLSLLAPDGVLIVVTPVRERLTARTTTGLPEAELQQLSRTFGHALRQDAGPLAVLTLRTPATTPPG